jgi:hypothetical protein
MRLTDNFLISLAVLAFVFTVSLAWAFRGDLIPPMAAALDRIGIAIGLKETPKMADKNGTETSEKEISVERSGIDQLVSEMIGLEKSRRELSKKVGQLKDEIGALQSEIEDLEFVIVEAESGVDNGELQRDLDAVNEGRSEEKDLLVEEPRPAEETPEPRFFKDGDDRVFREYVDYYVDWLRDTKSLASENQKAYICRNSNVSQFLAVNEDAALREACNITGYSSGVMRNNVTRNQKSFLCRNLNVTRFLSAFKNVTVRDLCGE